MGGGVPGGVGDAHLTVGGGGLLVKSYADGQDGCVTILHEGSSMFGMINANVRYKIRDTRYKIQDILSVRISRFCIFVSLYLVSLYLSTALA
jgi:hypothetical protein